MRVGENIFSVLSNAGGVANYVQQDSSIQSRIYPVIAPQGCLYPLVVYQKIGGRSIQSMRGPSGLAYQRFLVKCFVEQEDYDSLEGLTEQVRLALDGYQNIPNGISSIILDREPTEDFDDSARVWFSILEFIVGFEESKAS